MSKPASKAQKTPRGGTTVVQFALPELPTDPFGIDRIVDAIGEGSEDAYAFETLRQVLLKRCQAAASVAPDKDHDEIRELGASMGALPFSEPRSPSVFRYRAPAKVRFPPPPPIPQLV